MTDIDDLYHEIIEIISSVAGTEGIEYTLGKFTGLGWFFMPYETSTYKTEMPYVSVKRYDKTVNVYAMSAMNGRPIEEALAPVFGKTSVGKGCIRVRKLDDERIEALREVVSAMRSDYEKYLSENIN